MLHRVALMAALTAALSNAMPTDGLFNNLVARAPWQPAVAAPWQIILNKVLSIDSTKPAVTPDVGIYDIDMFDHNKTTVVASLHKLNKKVICYFSAGSYEPNRPDSSQFPREAFGNELDGWPGEYWINTNNAKVRTIMQARIKLASQMGCDAIDPDNVDAFDNTNGLGLTATDATNYVKFLATEAAKYNMAIGLKNALDILSSVSSVIQFAVNEQCSESNECSRYSTFIKTKPVFHIEYTDSDDTVITPSDISSGKPCTHFTNVVNFSTVVKVLDLNGKVTYCDGKTYTTATLA